MSILKKNVFANYGSSLFVALMNLLFVPLYIKWMGIESYGLVGAFSALLAGFAVLDMGLGRTLMREMARLGARKNTIGEMRDLLRTLELPYWGVALLIGLIIIILSPFLAYHWFNLKNLPPSTVEKAVLYMGLAVAFQWPLGFYSGGLMGRNRQVLLGVLNSVMAVFRGVGAVLILWLVSPTIEVFFKWQILVSAAQTGLTAFFLWHSLIGAPGHQPRFRSELLRKIWRFAAGVAGISLLGTILTQMDKVIITRMLSLEIFGYYSVATTVAMALFRLIGPVHNAAYPLLTHYYELKDERELAGHYHKSCQLIAVLTLPAALLLCFFSREILTLWKLDAATVESAHLLVSILVIGTAFNGLMNIPYALQLAAGWTRLNFMVNLVSVFVLVPLTILLTHWYGAMGTAFNWLLVNGAYLVTIIPIMHGRLLKKEMGNWYVKDVFQPLAGVLIVAGAARYLVPLGGLGFLPQIISLGAIGLLATLAAAVCAPAMRELGLRYIRNYRSVFQ